jgi:hypothetical protein
VLQHSLQGPSGDGQNFLSQQAKIIPDHRGVVHVIAAATSVGRHMWYEVP